MLGNCVLRNPQASSSRRSSIAFRRTRTCCVSPSTVSESVISDGGRCFGFLGGTCFSKVHHKHWQRKQWQVLFRPRVSEQPSRLSRRKYDGDIVIRQDVMRNEPERSSRKAALAEGHDTVLPLHFSLYVVLEDRMCQRATASRQYGSVTNKVAK